MAPLPADRHVSNVSAYGLLVLGVGGISTAALWIRLSGDPGSLEGGLAGELAFRRLALSLPFLAVWAWLRGRPLVPTPLPWRRMCTAGLCLAAHFQLWTVSLAYLPTPTSLILVSLHPVIVFAIEVSRGRFPARRLGATGIVLALGGTIVLAGHGGSEGHPHYWRGVLCATASAVAMTGYLLAGRSLRPWVAASTYAFGVYGVAAVALAIYQIGVGGRLFPADARGWQLAFLLALFPTLLGHTPLNTALKRLPATVISTAFLGEVVGGSLLVFVVVGESVPTKTGFYLGALAVTGGIIAVSLAGGTVSRELRSETAPR